MKYDHASHFVLISFMRLGLDPKDICHVPSLVRIGYPFVFSPWVCFCVTREFMLFILEV